MRLVGKWGELEIFKMFCVFLICISGVIVVGLMLKSGKNWKGLGFVGVEWVVGREFIIRMK